MDVFLGGRGETHKQKIHADDLKFLEEWKHRLNFPPPVQKTVWFNEYRSFHSSYFKTVSLVTKTIFSGDNSICFLTF